MEYIYIYVLGKTKRNKNMVKYYYCSACVSAKWTWKVKSKKLQSSRVDTSVKNRPLSENSISAIPNSLEIVTFVCNFTLGLASEINLITDELTDDALVSFTTSSFIKGSLNGRL